jgi:8-oxo-(d)GTP phosphatase
MTEPIHAAGTVVWRPAANGGAEVLLVHRSKFDDWSLPKGKQEPGEHLVVTAVRETLEETSVQPVLGPRLPDTEYLSWHRPKVVSYWSVRQHGPDAKASNEIDAVAWLPLAQARAQLTYERDIAVLDAVTPQPTVPLILLRHASAGQKGEWPADDEIRPLDAAGMTDAQRLADVLSCFAPAARVISSPAIRCTETVRPYAARFGGTVEADAVLSPPGRSGILSARTGRASSIADLLYSVVADARPAVICLHRENLPHALAAALRGLGAPGAGPPAPALPKGGFYVLHAAQEMLCALERYEL